MNHQDMYSKFPSEEFILVGMNQTSTPMTPVVLKTLIHVLVCTSSLFFIFLLFFEDYLGVMAFFFIMIMYILRTYMLKCIAFFYFIFCL